MNVYTHMHILLDRTGSMEQIRGDTIGGFNSFLNEQKKIPAKATISLIQFDSQDPYEEIYNFVDLQEAQDLTRETFVPRAATPLLDAIGRSINDVEEKIKLTSGNKPDKVVIVIITDGCENASKEFTQEQIRKMIDEKQSEDNWQFVFLSADLNSIDDARHMGMRGQSVMSYGANAVQVDRMYSSFGKSVAEFRTGADSVAFTDADREQQSTEK